MTTILPRTSSDGWSIGADFRYSSAVISFSAMADIVDSVWDTFNLALRSTTDNGASDCISLELAAKLRKASLSRNSTMPRCCVVIVFLSSALVAQDAPPVSLDDRLKIELFAEHPQLVTPTGIDVDHLG